MDFLKADNKIILRPDNGLVSEDFVENFKLGSIKTTKSSDYIRIEHPNCAFFKSVHTSGEKELSRTTLYTPEGRLHIDIDTQSDTEAIADKYIKKQDHLNILLFYLRDLEVKSTLKDVSHEAIAIEMPKTPIVEFIDFVDDALFAQVIAEYEMSAKHILSQLRRIYNAKIDILAQKIKGKVEYAIFKDISNIGLSDDLMDRWHYYYIRKSRLLK